MLLRIWVAVRISYARPEFALDQHFTLKPDAPNADFRQRQAVLRCSISSFRHFRRALVVAAPAIG